MSKEDFRREVERELTGREEELAELIYFKVYTALDDGGRASAREEPDAGDGAWEA